jgi:hypothetical protein
MEPIALLAELHAGGRVTVQRMRSCGLNTLEDICHRGPEALARTLNISLRSAHGMLREAQAMVQENLFQAEKQIAPDLDNLPAQRQQPSGFKAEVLDMVAKRFR